MTRKIVWDECNLKMLHLSIHPFECIIFYYKEESICQSLSGRLDIKMLQFLRTFLSYSEFSLVCNSLDLITGYAIVHTHKNLFTNIYVVEVSFQHNNATLFHMIKIF